METIWKNPKMSTYYLTIAILGIALVESAAIYWLILSMQLLNSTATLELAAIGIGLAIWLAGLWVWIWEGKMVSWALQAMKQNPESKRKIMTFMILFLALIESAAIYGLVIWYQLLSSPDISPVAWLIAIIPAAVPVPKSVIVLPTKKSSLFKILKLINSSLHPRILMSSPLQL